MIVDKDIPYPLENFPITDKEKELILLFRKKIVRGECHVIVQAGQPEIIKEYHTDYKLGIGVVKV